MVIKAIFDRSRSEPDRPAMMANGLAYSSAQVARGILAAEAMIKSFHLKPDDRIGIAVRELGKAWLFILAAEKMGHLATALPSESTAGQIGLKGIGLWIADRHVRQSWTGPTMWIEDDTKLGFDPQTDLSQRVDDPTHEVRFVLYSSGTTGVYKRIASRGPTRDARIASAVAEGREADTKRHYIGDFGPWTAYGYMQVIRGFSVGSLVVFEQRLEPWRAILAHRPTDFFVTPGTALRFLKMLPPDFPRQDDMSVSVSGGALTPGLLDALQGRLTRKIVQSYGATEAGLVARTPIYGPDDLLDHALLDTAEIQAVDQNHQPLPLGQEGILRVRRPHMAPGYFEDPVSTAEHFRDGWFYPGDIGVISTEKTFRLTGRATEVINANGSKIAPGPIEDRLRAKWHCDDVAVLSQAHTGSRDSLHIFVVRPRHLNDGVAKDTLKPLAPAFSRIQVHHVPFIPRTTTGKIQYRLLREGLQNNNAGPQ